MLPWLFREGEEARFDEQVLEAVADWVVDGEPRGIVVRPTDADVAAMQVLASLWTARSHGIGGSACWVAGSLPPLLRLAHIRNALPRPVHHVAAPSLAALALEAPDCLRVGGTSLVVFDGLESFAQLETESARLPESTLLIAVMEPGVEGAAPDGFLDIKLVSAPRPVAPPSPLGWFCPRTPIPEDALRALGAAPTDELIELPPNDTDRRTWALRHACPPPEALGPLARAYLEALLAGPDRAALWQMLPHLLRIARRGDPDSDAMELIYLALGQGLREAGDPEAADPWLERALLAGHASEEVRALARFERAKAAMYTGRWDAAADHLEPVLPALEALFGQGHMVAAAVIDMAAQVQYQRGDWPRALARGHDAIVALGNAHGPWSDFVALALGRQGEVLLATGAADEASQCLRMAVSMGADTLGDEHRRTRSMRDSWHQAIHDATQQEVDGGLADLLRAELSASRWLQILDEVGLAGGGSIEEILADLQPFPVAWRRLAEACDRHLTRRGWPHPRFRRLAGITPGAPSAPGHFVAPDLAPPPAGSPWSDVLTTLAEESGDVVIVGAPGVGKSAVAAWHGSTWRQRRYPGGVFWVEPHLDRDPTWSLAAFADQIWGHLQVGVPEKAYRVRAYLRATRCLLVLDDLREDTVEPWVRLIPGGQCRTVVTARSAILPNFRAIQLRPQSHPFLALLTQSPAPPGDERTLRRALGRSIDAVLADVSDGARTLVSVASIVGMEALALPPVAALFDDTGAAPYAQELCARHLLDDRAHPPVLPPVVREHLELSGAGPDHRRVLERLLACAEDLPATTRERVWNAAGRLYPLPDPLVFRWAEVGIELAVDELAADYGAAAIPRLSGLWDALEERPRPHLQAVVAYHLARVHMALGALGVASEWFARALEEMERVEPAPDDVEAARALFVARILALATYNESESESTRV